MNKLLVALGAFAGVGVITLASMAPNETSSFLRSRWNGGDAEPATAAPTDVAVTANLAIPMASEPEPALPSVEALGADSSNTDVIEVADAGFATDESDFVPGSESDMFSHLMRIPDHEVEIAPTVSREVLGTSYVKKIGYGNVTKVSVVTTATGVYSSDAMRSPNVLYPGVKVTPRDDDAFVGLFALLGGRWIEFQPVRAGSFVHYGSGYGGSYRTDGRTTCVSGKGYYGCY